MKSNDGTKKSLNKAMEKNKKPMTNKNVAADMNGIAKPRTSKAQVKKMTR